MRKLLLFLLTALLTFPALAEEAPVLSQEAQLLRTANRALEEKYGLTPHLLGLFDTHVTRYGDAAVVRYLPRSRPHPSLAGEYIVLITEDSAQARWTHDDVDPAVWQSGSLRSPAWGAPQLTAYLLTDSFEREYFDAPYVPGPDVFPESIAEFLASSHNGLDLRSKELTEDECAPWIARGRAAAQAMYGLDDETTAALRVIDVTLYLRTDGVTLWRVYFYHRGEPDEINYSVCLDGDTKELLHATVYTGGIG